MKYLNKTFFSKLKGRLRVIKSSSVKKLSALSLAVVLLVSGCGVKKEDSSVLDNSNNSTSYTHIENNNSNSSAVTPTKPIEVKSDLTETELQLLETQISISNQDSNQFSSYVHGISVGYEGSEYFGIEQAFQRYQNINEYETVSSNFIKDGRINETALKRQVLENNKRYLESTQSKKFTQLDTATFDTIFSHLMDSLNYQLQSGTSMDIAQLDDNLTNLRIFRMTSAGSGMVTDDGIMAFNLEVIATRQQQYPNVNYLRMTVLHEGNHFGQVSSVKERENEGYSRNLGIAYSWDDLKVNPLMYTWYVEASAEYLKNYQYGAGNEKTNNYENQVKSLESLTLATLLKDGVTETTVAQISLQPDLNKLFTLFNCQNDKDKLEVLQMMYSFEIFLNQPAEYSKFYKEATGHPLDIYNYHDGLKSSIAQTLTKQFYENLSSSTASHKYTLKEIFSIMATFETEMNRLTRFSSGSYDSANEGFLTVYNNIQLKYFELLAKSSNMSVDEISALYSSYFHDNLATVSQINVDAGKQNFLNEILQDRESNRKKTVSEKMGKSKIK